MKQLLSEKVKVGDYVSYAPTNKRYVVSSEASGADVQVYNLSKLKLWRVLRVDSNFVELIATEAPMLALCGGKAYSNLVKILDAFGSACVNPKYAVTGRSVGSTIEAFSHVNIPTWKEVSRSLCLNLSAEEAMYDQKIIKKHGLSVDDNTGIWLPVRLKSCCQKYALFGAWLLVGNDIVGGMPDAWLYRIGPGIKDNIFCENGVLPTVRLKKRVMVSSGKGTIDSPFKLTI